MGYQIHFDEATQTAMLVDPAGPWGLGPCLVGPTSRDTLAAFVGGLDQDPAELTTWELATTWQQFLALMGSVVDDAPGDGAPIGARTAEWAAGIEGATPEPAAQTAGEGTAVMEAGRDDPPEPAPADPDVWPPCPNCTSTKREALPGGGVVCATCGVELD